MTPYEQSRPNAALVISAISSLMLLIMTLLKPGEAPKPPVPDFASYANVSEKKQQFFDHFRPIIDEQNQIIETLRQQLKEGSHYEQARLETLAKAYRLNISNPINEADVDALLKHIDVLPSSLVLSQAAIESAWGTSRFAKEGYNFFGQWCFSKGCGLVPNSRDAEAQHEVRKFSSPKESVQAYYHNINSHPSYAFLREIRQLARKNGKPIHGCELALGLEKYSERGFHYINEIRRMIRVNDLSPHNESACADIPLDLEPSSEESPLLPTPAIPDTTLHSAEASSNSTTTSESAQAN